jgi:hypothetical protein
MTKKPDILDIYLQPYADWLAVQDDEKRVAFEAWRFRRYLTFIARDTRDPLARFIACTALGTSQEHQKELEEYFNDLAKRTHTRRDPDGSISVFDA